MNIKKYFKKPQSIAQRHYEALKLHYLENLQLSDAAERFDLSVSYLAKEKTRVAELIKIGVDPFFIEKKTGPKIRYKADLLKDEIISLRKLNHSIIDIKSILESRGDKISHDAINNLLKEEGFARLPRRTYAEKTHLTMPNKIHPSKTTQLTLKNEEFSTGRSGGILTFLPLMERLGIINAIQNANFPKTKDISSESYVLSFLALKLLGNKRLSHDESWGMDRVLGLFAGLNVLPKSASLSSYSYRVSRECNRTFLSELSRIFNNNDACEFNLDFKTIPHWGDESVLEKNYATDRGKSVKSVLALIVQNITKRNIAYTNAEITHDTSKDSILEFVDFWKENHGTPPKMLIFDSQFTIYENLKKLDNDNIKFLTLRRRREEMLVRANAIPRENWQLVEVEAGKRKSRKVQVFEETIKLPKYKGEIRQIIIIDHSKEPVFMLTNDFTTSAAVLVRKYGQRWLVEQEIAEQIAFFHLNQLSSSIVVKVDFDLTMTVLAHNLYRCLAEKIDRHDNCTVQTLHRRFIEAKAIVKTTKNEIQVTLSKRSHSPLLFELPWVAEKSNISWMGCKIGFQIGTTS